MAQRLRRPSGALTYSLSAHFTSDDLGSTPTVRDLPAKDEAERRVDPAKLIKSEVPGAVPKPAGVNGSGLLG